MTFRDLYETNADLKSHMLVDITIGQKNEAMCIKDCLKKYGSNEVICFALIGSYVRFPYVVLKED